jgi:hypothetical protein
MLTVLKDVTFIIKQADVSKYIISRKKQDDQQTIETGVWKEIVLTFYKVMAVNTVFYDNEGYKL